MAHMLLHFLRTRDHVIQAMRFVMIHGKARLDMKICADSEWQYPHNPRHLQVMQLLAKRIAPFTGAEQAAFNQDASKLGSIMIVQLAQEAQQVHIAWDVSAHCRAPAAAQVAA